MNLRIKVFPDCGYQPEKMQGKMVSFFRGLLREAGLLSDDQKTREKPNGHLPIVPYVPKQEQARAQLNGRGSRRLHYPTLKRQVDVLQLLLQMPDSPDWTEKQDEWWIENFRNNVKQLEKLLDGEESV